MTMTPLTPTIRIRDLVTDDIVATSTELIDYQVQHELSKGATGTFEVGLGDPVALAIVTANGGIDGKSGAKPYLLEFLLSPNTVDFRMLVTTPEITIQNSGSVVLTGNDIFDLYTRTGIDRVTFHSIPIQSMLNGAAGTIPADGTGLILKGVKLPYQKGIFQTKPGRSSWAGQKYLVMTPIVDHALRDLQLDVDLNADKIADGLDNIMKAVGGYYLPSDSAALGTRQYWVADSSDASLNVTGIRNGIACGFVGKTSRITFTNQMAGDTVDETTIAALLDPIVIDPNTDEMCSQASFIGGKSDHGLPAGGSITAMTTIRYNHVKTATNWDASLLVVGVSTSGNGGGGVFFCVQDGAFRPMSQAMDVNDLAYDPVAGILYAGTAAGVFSHSDNPLDLAPWQRIGGLSLPVTKIVVPLPPQTAGPDGGPTSGDLGLYTYVVDSNGTVESADPVGLADQYDVQRLYVPGGAYAQNIVALVSGGGSGTDGIYLNTSGSGSAALGYSGWTQLVASSSIVDVGASLSSVLYADSNNPSFLQMVSFGGSPGVARQVPEVLGGSPTITGIDSQPESGYTYIRTSAGALGLFCLAPGSASFTDANVDQSLVDPSKQPVMVNRICENRPKSTINGVVVPIFAMTDNGVYWSNSPLGGNWLPSTGQSAMDSTTVNLFCCGAQQTVLGRVLVRLYAGGGNSIYQSNTGGIWWRDLLNNLLDKGPFWMALAQQSGGMPFADNMLSGLGNINPYSHNDTAGTINFIPKGNPRYLPPGWIWSRRLDEHNDFCYRLVNYGSSDPHNGIEYAELSELSTDVVQGAITASERIALAEYRWLSQASTPQTRATLNSFFWTQEARLRRLRPSHQVTAQITETFVGTDGTIRTLIQYDSAFWVLSHMIKRGTDGAAETQTVVSSVLHAQPLTEQDIEAALQTSIKNSKRYRF